MDFHEFILFFVFLPLQTRAEGLRKGQSRFRGTSLVGSFRWGDKAGGAEVALSWHLLVGSFRWGDKIGGAEVALRMPLPDELQQES